MKRKHIGSNFDDFLREEGILEEIEEKVRRKLSQTSTNSEKMSDVFEKYFGLENGIDLDVLKLQQKPHNPIKFDTR